MSSEGPQPPYDPEQQPGQPGWQQQPGQPGQPGQPDQGPVVYPPPGTQGGSGWGQQPPPPGYAPPPQDPYAHLRRDHPRATTAMVLGIVGIVLCGLAAPFAWRMGKNAVEEIDRSQGILTGRGQAQAGQILGLIGTILLGLSLLFLVFALIIGIGAGLSST